ncbi:MAG: HD domain-containing protein, partial [Chloroflexota bacterium]|nr:HD domain-containing protein [Chloroflexota bacterium]
MTTALRFYTFATVTAGGFVLAAVTVLFSLDSEIGGIAGLVFWVILATVASAMPVRLPQGTLVGVGFAPLLASMVLGGPLAAAWAGAIGTFEWREVSGKVPWYGTAFNHAVFVLAGTASGLVYVGLSSLAPPHVLAGPIDFLALGVAAVVYFLVNNLLVTQLVALRTGKSFTTIWVQDVQGIAPNLLALAPLGWLMAQIFKLPDGVGWWATPLFVVPLFTTRLAYNRYVESRQLFIETVSALANAVDARDKYTHGHSRRVMRISGAMSRVMKVSEQLADRIEWASLLHDIGKIGIRDNILLKEGPLTPEERLVMNQHPVIGAEIVAPTRQLASEAPLIRAHHEWFNG